MSPVTKDKALEKLAAIANKVGYPDTWRDYSAVKIVRGDLLGNRSRASAFELQRQLAKIGKPVDRGEWSMTPPTVNAYYNPLLNDINFPVGILQPPFFDLKMDDGVNYGGDRRGDRARADPRLRRPGPPVRRERQPARTGGPKADAKEFEKRAQCVVDQYGSYAVADDLKQNGQLTLGENVADNGGVRIAYMALLESLKGQPAAKLDGFTPEQRFFLGWGQVWCAQARPEVERLQVQTDPHSLPRFRVNGVVSQHAGVPEGLLLSGHGADGPGRQGLPRLVRTVLLAALAWSAALAATAAEGRPTEAAAATIAGRTISSAELDEKARGPLFQIRMQEYEARLRVLNGLIADEVLKREAEARHLSAEELLRAEVLQKAAAVTPEEIQSTYEGVKGRFANKPEGEVKAQIEQELKQQRLAERRQAFLKELKAKAGVQVLARAASARRGCRRRRRARAEAGAGHDPRVLRLSVPVLRSRRAHDEEDSRGIRRPGAARVPRHAAADASARPQGRRGGGVRRRPGQILGDARSAVRRQGPARDRGPQELRGRTGSGPRRLRNCLDSGKNEPRWKAGKAAAEGYGITGTPAFFINGRFVSGARPFEVFAEIIDDELARAARAKPVAEAK